MSGNRLMPSKRRWDCVATAARGAKRPRQSASLPLLRQTSYRSARAGFRRRPQSVKPDRRQTAGAAGAPRGSKRRPSGRQSNSAWPPSCDSMLAITLRVPNPRDAGFSTRGPPVSTHTILSRPAWSSQLTDSRPDSVDSAPYFAELVTSSCSASATVCAVAGSKLDLRAGQCDLIAGRNRAQAPRRSAF